MTTTLRNDGTMKFNPALERTRRPTSAARTGSNAHYTEALQDMRTPGEHPEADLPQPLRGCGLRHLGFAQSSVARHAAYRVMCEDQAPVVHPQIPIDFTEEQLMTTAATPDERRHYRDLMTLRRYQTALQGHGPLPRALRGMDQAERDAVWRAVERIPQMQQTQRSIIASITQRVARDPRLRAALVEARAGHCTT